MSVERVHHALVRPHATIRFRASWYGRVAHRRRDQLRRDWRPTEAPVRATTTRVSSTAPLTESDQSRSSIRGVLPFGDRHDWRASKRKGEHIRCPDEIAVPGAATLPAHPATTAYLLFMPTRWVGARTTGASFRSCPDRDSGSRSLLFEVTNIPTIFPLAHPLIVAPARFMATDAVGVADVEFTDTLLLGLFDHEVCPLMA